MGNFDNIKKELEEATLPVLPNKKDYKIGIIGSGFIVQGCHLVAYKKAGFNPFAISSLELDRCNELAKEFDIGYNTLEKRLLSFIEKQEKEVPKIEIKKQAKKITKKDKYDKAALLKRKL